MTPSFLHGLLTLNRQLLDEVICNHLGGIEEYIDPDFLKEAYRRIISREKVDDPDIMTVWRAVILALWLKHNQVMP